VVTCAVSGVAMGVCAVRAVGAMGCVARQLCERHDHTGEGERRGDPQRCMHRVDERGASGVGDPIGLCPETLAGVESGTDVVASRVRSVPVKPGTRSSLPCIDVA